jgi:formylglycine-generating enzyme required for sulfatase activity
MYAAAGGSQQRLYPWSLPPGSEVLSDAYAVYSVDGTMVRGNPADVGSRPKGRGRFGQLDLAGNVYDFVLDAYPRTSFPATCNDCADLSWDNSTRSILGGAFEAFPQNLESAEVYILDQTLRRSWVGGRCARDP